MRFVRLRQLCWYALVLWFAAEGLGPREARAHSGRRFLVGVANGALQAQGVNTGAADGSPAVRPYPNVIHDHWHNIYPDPVTGLSPFANSLLPDMGVPASAQLRGYDLTLTLLGAKKWVNPPEMPTPGLIPQLQPLAPGETIYIETVNSDVSTDSPGTLLLSVSVPAGGISDILLNYTTYRVPTNAIDVLTFRLSAKPADPSLPDLIADSAPIHVLLSPDGANSAMKMHHAALFLESYLAHPVPEPSAWALAVAALGGLHRVREARRRKP